ncbi:putative molybdenum carrier protein [Marinobacterium arenosum]|uniref:putative molybdenum carrier protein n=1 Tax=Marinobacterium arenosum TaxID=2862496 RepID=UPI001C96EB79|nr:putative molybdenum carrier protein [Marinobacterium arenosum]MBY4676233.1 putative molybdenum carrier protein [Marinobacterium arenosum]
MLKKILSGGQTGADRAALDAALELDFPCGGWCPQARLAEDGHIDPRYPLSECDGDEATRTWLNVETADGTVVFYQDSPSGGTAYTLQCCLEMDKPCKLIDISLVSPESAAGALEGFVEAHSLSTLNVAGPRASKCPEIGDYVGAVIRRLLSQYRP